MVDIPDTPDSGTLGTQLESVESIDRALVQTQPSAGHPIEQTVQGLAATKSRSLGGEVAANLLAGSVSQLSYEANNARADARSLQVKLDDARERLSDERVRSAELQVLLSSAEDEKKLRNVCLIAGTAIAGFGIDQVRSENVVVGSVLTFLGVVLALAGWFSFGRRTKK